MSYKATLELLKTTLQARTRLNFLFADGDVITTLLEIISGLHETEKAELLKVLAKAYNPALLSETELDNYLLPFIRRLEGYPATSIQRFYRAEGYNNDITIPAGTKVAIPANKNSPMIVFKTLQELYIPSNTPYGETIVVSLDNKEITGAANTITVLLGSIEGIDRTTNIVPITPGLSKESNEYFVKRYYEYLNGLGKCTYKGIEYTAIEAGAIDAKIDWYTQDDNYIILYVKTGYHSIPTTTVSQLINGNFSGVYVAQLNKIPVLDVVSISGDISPDNVKINRSTGEVLFLLREGLRSPNSCSITYITYNLPIMEKIQRSVNENRHYGHGIIIKPPAGAINVEVVASVSPSSIIDTLTGEWVKYVTSLPIGTGLALSELYNIAYRVGATNLHIIKPTTDVAVPYNYIVKLSAVFLGA